MQLKEELPYEIKPSTSTRMSGRTQPNNASTVTGKDILRNFLSGDPVALQTYSKICSAISMLDRMQEVARTQLLTQFFDCTSLADDRCQQLVEGFAQLSWHSIPSSILPQFRKMLTDLAIQHVCHTELIFKSAIAHFSPILPISQEDDAEAEQRPLTEADQLLYYRMAHHIVAAILKCFPTATKTLMRVVQQSLPHRTARAEKIRAFVRNAIQLAEQLPQLRRDIWAMLIEEIVTIDNFCSHSHDETHDVTAIHSTTIFALDEELEHLHSDSDSNQQQPQSQQSSSLALLDSLIADVIVYLAKVYGREEDYKQFDSSWLQLRSSSSPDEMFSLFLTLHEQHLLMAVHTKYVPLIWLYLCSLDEAYYKQMCNTLWSIVIRPTRVQSDIKKGHGAAAYLASFLARAKYASSKDAFYWISKISGWLVQYVDQCGPVNMGIGIRHGTFYVLCQTLFIIFSFRYREFVKNGEEIEEIRRLSLGRIIHSPLDPLRHINRHVSLCFSAISRSLQLVYCSHLVPSEQQAQAARPFEDMFPFEDTNAMQSSSPLVSDLCRKFAPLAEDLHEVKRAMEQAEEKRTDDSAMFDYLDEDDDVQMGSVRSQSHMLIELL